MTSGRWIWLGIAGASVVILIVTAIPYLLWLELGVPTMLAGMAFAIVGGLLVARRPENALGYLLTAMGAVWAMGEAAYTYLAGVAVGELPPNDFFSWLNVWVFYPMLVFVVWVVAVFPSGRVASRWLAWPLRLAVIIGATDIAARMVVPVPAEQSPFGEEFAGNPWTWDALAAVGPLVKWLDYTQVGLIVLAVVDLVARWAGSRGVERLQMRWFALGLVVFAGTLLTAIAVEAAGITGLANELAWDAGAWFVGLGSVPVTIGIAVARYRLYEIDRIISRTVTYALIAGLLVAMYVAIVIGLPQILPVPPDSEFLVAGATLAAAALFNPLRKQVQGRVDRRFNRVRYDAQQQMDQLASRLRTELDLSDLTDEVLGVVAATMQPATANVWIRGDGR